jgi:AraC-like DNA-binding protein
VRLSAPASIIRSSEAASKKHQSIRNGVRSIEFVSRDPDATTVHVRNYGDHYRKVLGGGPYLYHESVLATDTVFIGHLRRSFRQILRASVTEHTLAIAPGPDQTHRHGRRTYEMTSSLAVLSAPGQEYTRKGGAGDAMLLRVKSSLLEAALDEHAVWQSRRWLVQSAVLNTTPARIAQIHAFEAQMRHAHGGCGSWGAYGSADRFERAVADWLAEWLVEAAAAKPVQQASLHRLAHLERWIDDHIGEDLTLDQLCGVARLSPRSLQKFLLATRGLTPLEFVRYRRLAAARRRLLQRQPHELISNIALDCGFQHLGRFSLSYRETYGESPRDTVAHGRLSRQQEAS